MDEDCVKHGTVHAANEHAKIIISNLNKKKQNKKRQRISVWRRLNKGPIFFND